MNINAAPNSSVAVTVEVEQGKVEVKAKNEHVSAPKVDEPKVSQPSQPSGPDPTNPRSRSKPAGPIEARLQLRQQLATE